MTNNINGIDVSECEYINCCSEEAKCIILQDDICSNSQYCKSEPDCYFKQLKRLQKENEELKEKIDIYENSIIANHDRAVGKRLMEVLQALEEIKKETNRLLYEENPIYGYNNSNYFELLAKYVLAKINEVLKCQ